MDAGGRGVTRLRCGRPTYRFLASLKRFHGIANNFKLFLKLDDFAIKGAEWWDFARGREVVTADDSGGGDRCFITNQSGHPPPNRERHVTQYYERKPGGSNSERM